MLEYQKSFSRLKLSAQLRNLKTLPEEIYSRWASPFRQSFIFNVNIRRPDF